MPKTEVKAVTPSDPHPTGAETRIGRTHLKMADPERSLAFPVGDLECELTQQFGSQPAFLSADDDHHHIGLNTWDRGGKPPAPGTTGPFHPTVPYSTRADPANACQRLIALGMPLKDASDHEVNQTLCLSDPDGNALQPGRNRPMQRKPPATDGSLSMFTRRPDRHGLLGPLPA